MRATEEAAFVPDRLKAYALSMACELLLKYCIVTNGGSPPEGVNTIIPVVPKWYHVLR